MMFNLTLEDELIRELKEELGIRPTKPHCINLELWRHGNSVRAQLQCRVSVFTNDDRCIQGNAANFGDALDEIRAALKPKTRALERNEEVKVTVEE